MTGRWEEHICFLLWSIRKHPEILPLFCLSPAFRVPLAGQYLILGKPPAEPLKKGVGTGHCRCYFNTTGNVGTQTRKSHRYNLISRPISSTKGGMYFQMQALEHSRDFFIFSLHMVRIIIMILFIEKSIQVQIYCTSNWNTRIYYMLQLMFAKCKHSIWTKYQKMAIWILPAPSILWLCFPTDHAIVSSRNTKGS